MHKWGRPTADEFFSEEGVSRMNGNIRLTWQAFLQLQFAAMHVELGFDVRGRQQVRRVLGFICTDSEQLAANRALPSERMLVEAVGSSQPTCLSKPQNTSHTTRHGPPRGLGQLLQHPAPGVALSLLANVNNGMKKAS